MEDIAKGAAKGTWEHWEEKLPEWLSRLKNHELRFIQDKATYEVAKRESDNAEYKLFSQFAGKGWPRVAFKLGLALRELEGDDEQVQALKDDIIRAHGIEGVHAAELAQRGILSQLVAQLTKILGNPGAVKKKASIFLNDVDQLTLWVKRSDSRQIKRLCELVKRRVDTNPSQFTIVLGAGNASGVALSILECAKRDLRKYYVQIQQEGHQVAGFIFAPELAGRLTYWSEPFAKV